MSARHRRPPAGPSRVIVPPTENVVAAMKAMTDMITALERRIEALEAKERRKPGEVAVDIPDFYNRELARVLSDTADIAARRAARYAEMAAQYGAPSDAEGEE